MCVGSPSGFPTFFSEDPAVSGAKREPAAERRPATQWILLILATVPLSLLLHVIGLPASVLLGAMAMGIVFSVTGRVRSGMPATAFAFGQAVIGCLVAGSLTSEIVHDIVDGWPSFLVLVLSVSAICAALGWFLTKMHVVPGTTAIWGTSPGAAMVMTVMSDGYGADGRLVAFMQYLRVIMVTVSASLVAAIWGVPSASSPDAVAVASQASEWIAFASSLVLCAVATWASIALRKPMAALLFPMIAGFVLNLSGVVEPSIPSWLLAVSNALVGWGIGLRFTRAILQHAFGALPKLIVAFIFLIAASGAVGLIFGRIAGIDPLTAYLAASPGGMDAMAIIAASAGGDMSFLMAVQTMRFVLVMLTGPALAKLLAKKINEGRRGKDDKNVIP